MSRAAFERVMGVTKVLKGMQTLHDLVGEAPVVQLSDAGAKRWMVLRREYDDFYELSLQERLEFSEMAKQSPHPGEGGKGEMSR